MGNKSRPRGGYVAAEPVRNHLMHLTGHYRMTVGEVSRASGVPVSTINVVMWGKRHDAQPAWMSRWTADRIMSTRPQSMAIGTERRLRALCAIGWSARAIASRYGVSVAATQRARAQSSHRTTQEIHQAARRAWRELCMTPAPDSPSARQARDCANRNGWPPPLAWDVIDDLDEQPTGWRRNSNDAHRTPAAVEAQWRLDLGESLETIARDLGVSVDAITRRRAA